MAQLEDVVARGAKKDVEAIAGTSSMVRCRFRNEEGVTRDQARGTFLMQRLANILAPGTLPIAYSFDQDPKTGSYYMDVERVALDALHLRAMSRQPGLVKNTAVLTEHNEHEIDYYEQRYDSSEIKEHQDNTVKRLEDIGFHAERMGLNWTLAENKVRYLDMGSPWFDKENLIDFKKLDEAIKNLSDENKRKEARTLFRELNGLVITNTSL